MKAKTRVSLFLLVLFALVSLGVLGSGVVIKDGDTLKIEDETWRLWGIDTPEDGQPCTIKGFVIDCGDRATDALAHLVGQAVPNCKLKDTDCYDRSVGQCYVDGRDLGAQLVRQGWALDYRRYNGGHYATQEEEAKRERDVGWRFRPALGWRRELRQKSN